MNKKLFLIPLIIVFLFFMFYQASASCVIQGYVVNSTGYITANVSGYCQSDNSWVNLTKNAGALYQLSWGGPADNCDAFCGNVYITGVNTTLSFLGYPYNATTLVYYYPMNSSNTPRWSSGDTHNVNISTIADITPPTITILSPTSIYYYNTQSVWFNVTTNENASWCGYSLDGTSNRTMTNSSGNWNNQNTTMSEGTHSVLFFCNDTSGNMGSAGPRTFYIDVTNPIATFGTNPIDNYNSSSTLITFDGKCSDNVGLSSIQIWGNWSSGWASKNSSTNPTNDTFYNLSVSSIPDGTWKWAVYCVDKSQPTGWTNFTDTNRTFSVVTTALTISIQSPTNRSYNTQSIWFNVTTTQTASWCGYSLDGTSNRTMTNSSGNWNNQNTTMSEKQHNVIFYCNNTVGIMSSSSRVYFTVDLTPPNASTNNPLNGSTWTSSQTVTFNLKCTDNLGLDYLRLWINSTGWAVNQTNTSPINNSWWNPSITLPNGVYKWAAWCNDTAGWTNMTENITFTVNYAPSSPGGGGGGGISSTCSNYGGTCYSGNVCPSEYDPSTNGTCSYGEVCCKLKIDICSKCYGFISKYSIFGYSMIDFDSFFSTLNTTEYNKSEVQDYIKNFNKKCYNFCPPFFVPVLGPILEKIGRAIWISKPCYVAWIIIIIIISLVIYLLVKKKKKKYRK